MAGMNLLQMIMSAQNGAVAQQAGAQAGLNPQQAQGAIAALLPAISSALKMNTAKPEGLAGLLGALQKGNHSEYLQNPQAMARPETVQDGNAILGHLFGSKDVSRAVAGHAAQQTGLDVGALKKLLPMVASMAMGSMATQTRGNGGLASGMAGLAVNKMMGGGVKGGIAQMVVGQLMGGNKRRQRAAQQEHQKGLGLLGSLMDADGDGSNMDDILGMAMKGLMNRR